MSATNTRPKYAAEYDANRKKVCAPCGRKIPPDKVRELKPDYAD